MGVIFKVPPFAKIDRILTAIMISGRKLCSGVVERDPVGDEQQGEIESSSPRILELRLKIN